jgi:hypothetical protein
MSTDVATVPGDKTICLPIADGVGYDQLVKDCKNLLPEELRILFLILGQDMTAPIALKGGGSQPIGMGTMTMEITKIEHSQDVRDRYRSYDVENAHSKYLRAAWAYFLIVS